MFRITPESNRLASQMADQHLSEQEEIILTPEDIDAIRSLQRTMGARFSRASTESEPSAREQFAAGRQLVEQGGPKPFRL